jgi:tRNA pseudouridine55 synthase
VTPGGAAFLLVDKASGWTSHDVVAKVRNLARIKKVGHAGTLDPMATGLLVLGLGRATRLLRFVQNAAKQYVAQVQFGVATDSLDADGAILERSPMPITEEELRAVFPRFTGTILQEPPMVSARKVEGRRLYELAREGKEVEREARPVTISTLELIQFAPSAYPEATIRVRCSKGTYIRTLADDLARALGGRAHLTALRRVGNGSLDVAVAHTVEEIEKAATANTFDTLLLDAVDGLPDLPRVEVGEEIARAVANGVPVAGARLDPAASGPVRIVANGELVAVYRLAGEKAVPEVVLG